MLATIQYPELLARVGKDFLGRIISVTGEPLDGKGAVAADASWPVFNPAPPIYQRERLETQLETGVTVLDSLFPMVRGQRLALLGDSKSGKTTLATQIAINQQRTDQVVVYVLIAKRRSDVDTLIARLNENKAMSKAIVIVSSIYESLALSYLAPYVGCAMAEYMWQKLGTDTLIIYDDLTTHAHAYREIALISGTSPGRDSYPGDIFHTHSTLLERSGRLSANHRCLTAIPLVTADGGDITAFLPTNVMSITDGQWILDMKTFREGVRPALNVGLSVTRVGMRGYNDRQKAQNSKTLKAIAAYNQAQQFAHFGSELSDTAKNDMILGTRLRQLFTQQPDETYNLITEQLMLDTVFEIETSNPLDISMLKNQASLLASQIKSEQEYESAKNKLKGQMLGTGDA